MREKYNAKNQQAFHLVPLLSKTLSGQLICDLANLAPRNAIEPRVNLRFLKALTFRSASDARKSIGSALQPLVQYTPCALVRCMSQVCQNSPPRSCDIE